MQNPVANTFGVNPKRVSCLSRQSIRVRVELPKSLIKTENVSSKVNAIIIASHYIQSHFISFERRQSWRSSGNRIFMMHDTPCRHVSHIYSQICMYDHDTILFQWYVQSDQLARNYLIVVKIGTTVTCVLEISNIVFSICPKVANANQLKGGNLARIHPALLRASDLSQLLSRGGKSKASEAFEIRNILQCEVQIGVASAVL